MLQLLAIFAAVAVFLVVIGAASIIGWLIDSRHPEARDE